MLEQHDNHIWLTVHGEGWAIRGIERGGSGTIYLFHLWRGYAPLLQYLDIQVRDPDWPGYCQRAVEMIEEEFG
jgi:hypothetical protein